MNNDVEPLFDDEFVGEPPTKRVMAYIQSYREQNAPVAGIYCGYAPIELIQALGIVPALLCAFANKPIAAAEEVLPANLCPLIKSSYGFIITDTCPFYGLSEAVIGETTCDGKKKMFEMISHRKPMFVMDLPQMPNEKEAKDYWAVSIRKLRTFLETTFDRKVLDSAIEEAIKDTNYKNSMMRKVFEYAALEPPVLSWNELYDMTFLALPATGKDMAPILEDIIQKLDSRVANGYFHGEKEAPRVMVTGCPVGGDSTKIFKVIEEAGGVVVALDSCTGMKVFMDSTEEDTADPVTAIAERYLRIPCSCMTPNDKRLTQIDAMIDQFKPDVIIDLILHACHSYNIESFKIGEHVKNNYDNISFLKIETDYSDSDVEQIRTRVETVLNIRKDALAMV